MKTRTFFLLLLATSSAFLSGCTNAAFAADLWTWATATDGYGRQSQYDRFDSHPFALLHP